MSPRSRAHRVAAAARSRHHRPGRALLSVKTSTFSDAGLHATTRRLRPMFAALSRPFRPALSRRSVFIQVEKTPNPFSLKFLPSQPVKLGAETSSGFHFTKGDSESNKSPLARKLFTIDHITGVFIQQDFVTVSKNDEGAWSTIKPHVFSHLMDFFAEGVDAVSADDESTPRDTEILDTDSEVVAMIKELIEVRIRPAVQEDGGDIFYRGFDEATGLVQVELAGSCVGCPSSSVTLTNGVENMLMHYVEEVRGIENVTPAGDEDDFKLSFDPPDNPHVSI